MNKLIVRADDLGISEAVNCGILKAIRDGVVTSTGLMTNMPFAQQGFNMVKETQVCLGMHGNISTGRPASNLSEIPSLVREDGNFYSSKEIAQKNHVLNENECEIELEAQLHRFREITGTDPHYFEGHAVFSKVWFEAQQIFAERNHLFLDLPGFDPSWEERTGIGSLSWTKPDEHGLYDPKKMMNNSLDNLKEHEACIGVFHPGYIDQYLLDNSSYTMIRVMECDFLCSKWLRDFLSTNKIELRTYDNYAQ